MTATILKSSSYFPCLSTKESQKILDTPYNPFIVKKKIDEEN